MRSIWVGWFLGACEYGFDDARHIIRNVGVPEPKNTKAKGTKSRVAQIIGAAAFFSAVLPAVELNNQLCPQAGEIDDVSIDRNLPSEMKVLVAKEAQTRPKQPLMFRRACSKRSRQLKGNRACGPPRTFGDMRRHPTPALCADPPLKGGLPFTICVGALAVGEVKQEFP